MNGIHVKTWIDDEDDNELYPLGQILQGIVEEGYEDVRDALE